MITKMMIMTPQDTPGQIASRKVGQSHLNLAVDKARKRFKHLAALACRDKWPALGCH